jgi:hypothetical protein
LAGVTVVVAVTASVVVTGAVRVVVVDRRTAAGLGFGAGAALVERVVRAPEVVFSVVMVVCT